MARFVALILVLALSSAIYAAEVFRWVDENGEVHYGDSVPERYKQKAKKLDSAGPPVTSEQRKEAEARLAREKAAVESMSKARESNSTGSKPGAPNSKRAAGDAGCAEQMKKYQESLACFDAYRNANGSVKAEAAKNCAQVQQPTGCQTEPSPSDRQASPVSSQPK
jgi:hypothetical protein